MVTDQQVKRLWRLAQQKLSLEVAAAKAGMDPKTARKYLRGRRLPSEMQQKHTWRTRPDPFVDVWDEIEQRLRIEPGLQAKTVFEYLQQREPGRFSDGQVRTLQRRMKNWRALEGPPREVFFAQDHDPGGLCQSDFTHCRELEVTVNGQAFPHLVYHFVLSYSNWETGTICYSETFESLNEGLQNALWELGGVPSEHRSDRMSAAVNNLVESGEFTRAYEALLRHYGLTGQKIQAGQAHENGDIEQRHYRFKQAADQAVMMRGSIAAQRALKPLHVANPCYILNQMVQYSGTVLDASFAALSDATRRGVLEQLGRADASITDLAEKFHMTLTGMKKQAGLVATEKVGRVRTCKLGRRGLDTEAAWIERQRQLWAARFNELDKLVEELKQKDKADVRNKR
jgi:DNA-binding transcriptional ArsR family regulator